METRKIDKAKLDKLIAMKREYFSDYLPNNQIVKKNDEISRFVDEWNKDFEVFMRGNAWDIASIISTMIYIKRDIQDHAIYAVFAFLGYEAEEVKEND